jgi:outer membrane lipoprotein-sorting protein
MLRAGVVGVALLALAPVWAISAQATAAKLTAAEIVDRNIAARGGLGAWRAVQTLSWSGKMDAGGNNEPHLKVPGMPLQPPPKDPAAQVQLPFAQEMQRGRKSRLEIQFNGQAAVQVYDGTQGWKLRPFLNRHEAEPYTAAELKLAASQSDLDGMLIDYTAKGTTVALEGVDKVEDRDAYKLRLTLKTGEVLHDWVDAKSFLEVKVDGTPRRLDKKLHAVSVYLRDYRSVNGLQIPHLIETVVQGVQRTEKIQIEKVAVNPHLDASRFAKPT